VARGSAAELAGQSERQSWKCWVCDIGGDVFSWVMRREGVEFPEALEMLAEQAGIELKPRTGVGGRGCRAERGSSADKKDLYRAMAWAIDQYHRQLIESPEGSAARDYLQQRGIAPESWRRFRLGWAPDQWDWLLQRAVAEGWSTGLLTAINVLAENSIGRRYDRFRGRLLFPIIDPQSRPIAIGGRILPGQLASADADPPDADGSPSGAAEPHRAAKYINSTETRLYVKHRTLYGLDVARDAIQNQSRALIMEGYTDVIMAHQMGLTSAVAVCGTALAEGHLSILRRYCREVVLVLDGDEAGRRRSDELLELFIGSQMNVRIATLPEGLDPCDLLRAKGAAGLQACIDSAVDALEHRLRLVCSGFDPLRDVHQANVAVEGMLDILARAPNPGRGAVAMQESGGLRRQQVLMRLARHFGLEQSQLQRRLAELQAGRRRWRSAASPEAAPQEPPRTYRLSDLTPIEIEVLEICLLRPDLVPIVLERVPGDVFQSPAGQQLSTLYTELELGGAELDFHSLMSAIEEPSLKSLIVSLEELASRKAKYSIEEPLQRLHRICEWQASKEQQAETHRDLQRLSDASMAEQEEIDLLQDLLARVRNRHGIEASSSSQEAD
jgi:DNA primase